MLLTYHLKPKEGLVQKEGKKDCIPKCVTYGWLFLVVGIYFTIISTFTSHSAL